MRTVPYAFRDSLYLVQATNSTRILIPAAGLIASSSVLSINFGSYAATSTGIKQTLIFRFAMPDAVLAFDVYAHLPWEIVTPAAGGALGRLNLDVQKEGVAVRSLIKANAGGRDLTAPATTRYTERLHARLPKSIFRLGERLDIRVEFEVTTAGTGTTEVLLLTDTSSIPTASIVEVYV